MTDHIEWSTSTSRPQTLEGTTFAPRTVVGYHGCSQQAAAAIIVTSAFSPSRNREDWLGSGVYFWEYAPHRALEWAETRYPSEPAVLEAQIRLGECLNLLDRAHFQGLAQIYDEILKSQHYVDIRVPVNTARGAHFLDREVIDDYCALTAELAAPFQTVRGCFPEGSAIYPGSKILDRAHVQLAVRDPVCISRIRQVNLG